MIIAVLVVFGLIFGSFVNACVWRLHEQEEIRERLALKGKKKPSAKEQKALEAQLVSLSILKGRSMCSNCKHELAPKDLVPLLSYLWLMGKCRYCRKPIQDPPIIELALPLLFVASYLWWPADIHGMEVFKFVVWLGFLVAFTALAMYDLRWYLLPNRIVYPLIAVAALETAIVAIHGSQISLLVQPVLGALLISGTFWVLFQVSGGRWIGGGDVKLAVVLGLLAATPLKALLLLFTSSVIGTVCSIPILLRGKKALKMQVPFGPFLLAATVVVVLFGSRLLDWYTRRLMG